MSTKSTTVRIDVKTHERLKRITAQTGEPLMAVIERAVEEEERRLFWRWFHEAVEGLRADPRRWAAYQAELRDLEGTLMDGLDPDEDWQWLMDAAPDAIESSSAAEVDGAVAR